MAHPDRSTGDPPTDEHRSRSDFEARAQAAMHDFEAGIREARTQFEETNAKVTARAGRNLVAAIGIGVVLGGSFLVSLIIVKWLFMVFTAVLIGFTVWELASALRFAGRDVPRVASTLAGVATVPAAFFWHVPGLWLAVLAAIVVVTLWRLAEFALRSRRRSGAGLLADLGAGVLVQVYVTFLAGFYVVLTGSAGGEWWTLAAIVVVVTTDLAAYVTGLAFGRHKLAPRISPGKTWEGFAGSVLVAVIAGVLLGWLMLGEPWWVGGIMGLLLALVGTVGDLTESLIKRDLGIKDISSMLPGHGGFLDRLDSILPSAAVAYAIFLVAGATG